MQVWENSTQTQHHIIANQINHQAFRLLFKLNHQLQVKLMFLSKETLKKLELLQLNNNNKKNNGLMSIKHQQLQLKREPITRSLQTIEQERVYTKTTGTWETPGQNLCKLLVDQVLLMFHSKEISKKLELLLLNSNNKKNNGLMSIKLLLLPLKKEPITRS